MSMLWACADHLDLFVVAHSGGFQVPPETAVDEPDRREILDARKAHLLELFQENRHEAERVGAAHSRQDRRVRHDGQHLGGHLHDDAVGVPVGHETGQRAAARHAVSTGVVDDDEVRPAGLGALGGDACPGAAADDRPASGHFGAHSPEDFAA